MTVSAIQPSLGTALKRGLLGRCPNCGKGKLYQSYLKQVDHCAACGEEYGHIRADDGPAWLTILLAGHIVVPLLLIVGIDSDIPNWISIIFWLALMTALVFLLLPRTKGVFIAALWHMKLAGPKPHKI